MFDTDNSGFITAEELREKLTTLGERMTDQVRHRQPAYVSCHKGQPRQIWLLPFKKAKQGHPKLLLEIHAHFKKKLGGLVLRVDWI